MNWLQHVVVERVLVGRSAESLKSQLAAQLAWLGSFWDHYDGLFLLNLFLITRLIKVGWFFIVAFKEFLVLRLINIGSHWGLVMFNDGFKILVMFLHLLMMTSALVRCSGLNNIGHYFEDFLSHTISTKDTYAVVWIQIYPCETQGRLYI